MCGVASIERKTKYEKYMKGPFAGCYQQRSPYEPVAIAAWQVKSGHTNAQVLGRKDTDKGKTCTTCTRTGWLVNVLDNFDPEAARSLHRHTHKRLAREEHGQSFALAHEPMAGRKGFCAEKCRWVRFGEERLCACACGCVCVQASLGQSLSV